MKVMLEVKVKVQGQKFGTQWSILELSLPSTAKNNMIDGLKTKVSVCLSVISVSCLCEHY